MVAANVTGENEFYAFEASTVVTTKSDQVGFYGLTFAKLAAAKVDGCDVTVCLSNAGLSGETYGDILIKAGTPMSIPAKTMSLMLMNILMSTLTHMGIRTATIIFTMRTPPQSLPHADGRAVGAAGFFKQLRTRNVPGKPYLV